MYEQDAEAYNCLTQLDAIINNTLEKKQSVDTLAKTALDKFAFYSDTLFLDKLLLACTILDIDALNIIKYILGKTNIKYSKKSKTFALVHKEEAKHCLHNWRQKKVAFSKTGTLVEEYTKEERNATKAATKNAIKNETLAEFQNRLLKTIKRLEKDLPLQNLEFLTQVETYIKSEMENSAESAQDNYVHDNANDNANDNDNDIVIDAE